MQINTRTHTVKLTKRERDELNRAAQTLIDLGRFASGKVEEQAKAGATAILGIVAWCDTEEAK